VPADEARITGILDDEIRIPGEDVGSDDAFDSACRDGE
jgi:hypothetical protein